MVRGSASRRTSRLADARSSDEIEIVGDRANRTTPRPRWRWVQRASICALLTHRFPLARSRPRSRLRDAQGRRGESRSRVGDRHAAAAPRGLPPLTGPAVFHQRRASGSSFRARASVNPRVDAVERSPPSAGLGAATAARRHGDPPSPASTRRRALALGSPHRSARSAHAPVPRRVPTHVRPPSRSRGCLVLHGGTVRRRSRPIHRRTWRYGGRLPRSSPWPAVEPEPCEGGVFRRGRAADAALPSRTPPIGLFRVPSAYNPRVRARRRHSRGAPGRPHAARP